MCLQPDNDVKLDAVGVPAPGVDVKIGANGEVLVRGPMLLKEYYNRPDATAESIDAEGFFHTGDAGFLDDTGQLKRIIDRAKDVGKLAGGAMFAPNYIENKLKFFAHIKEAVAFGDSRDRVCAFVNIDMGSVGNWAERKGLAYSGYADLAQKPEVVALVRECVDINAELAREGDLAASQIHRFLILHKELDPDDDELTRTRKVRRGFVAEKYAVLVDALYSGRDVQHIETLVRFEDGRSRMVAADIVVQEFEASAGDGEGGVMPFACTNHKRAAKRASAKDGS